MRTRTLCIAVAVLALAGCDVVGDPGDEDGTAASMRWHDCPGDVAIMLTARHRCGTLTIPAPRSRAGSTLDLAVLQTWPETDVGAADEVAASVGFNFGEPSHTAGEMALLAERLGVPVVSIAPRGVGEPGGLSLDCPEADGLGPGLAAIPDPEGRPAFITAVKDCHDRLVADGVDLDTFGTDDMVEDLELLRDALDVPRWYALVTYGELSRVSHAYAAAYADRVRASVTDSPLPGHLDAFTAATPGTRSAIAALVEECRASARCLARYPDLDQAWRRALARTAQRPIVGTSDGGRVLVDAPKLLRAVRAVLGGDGAAAVSDLPRMIVTAAEGRLHPTLATLVTRDPGFCNGYRPVCTKPGFSLGAYLSQTCPELAVEGPPADGDPTYAGVFADSPYVEACRVWDVDPLPLPPADGDVPTLALTGHLDSWSRPEWFADPVVVRGATHDVAGWSACAREVRNAWLSDPAAPADTGACLEAPLPAWD